MKNQETLFLRLPSKPIKMSIEEVKRSNCDKQGGRERYTKSTHESFPYIDLKLAEITVGGYY